MKFNNKLSMKCIVKASLVIIIYLVIIVFIGCESSVNNVSRNNDTENIKYEDYAWGRKKNTILNSIKNKDYKIIDNINEIYKNKIKYVDKLYNEQMKVTLFFTPKSNKLWSVVVNFEIINIANKIKKVLENKYGSLEVVKNNKKIKEYKKVNDKKRKRVMHLIIDKKRASLEIFYISKKYGELCKKEDKQIRRRQENKL